MTALHRQAVAAYRPQTARPFGLPTGCSPNFRALMAFSTGRRIHALPGKNPATCIPPNFQQP
ncbi:hypothetical protein ACS5NO_32030 [Larkinella sp. GY13]|uniref:hypothetical protein n=1 Tax=Larkinella sp. GY13 TaxID=3453720 RepID=UPI003EEE92C8